MPPSLAAASASLPTRAVAVGCNDQVGYRGQFSDAHGPALGIGLHRDLDTGVAGGRRRGDPRPSATTTLATLDAVLPGACSGVVTPKMARADKGDPHDFPSAGEQLRPSIT